MNKRYQVFVSSTFADLQDERSSVIQTLMEMDCIPSGMELFPAMDEEQFEFIKKVIDDCDYYLLLIGGRYGSTTQEGVSYTEKEYDYAVSKGLKVVALVHSNPDSIPAGKTDKDNSASQRLHAFREKVRTGRLVKHWSSAGELPGMVALSLSKTIKTYPAIGWVRGNAAASSELLSEMNELRKANDDLRTELASQGHSVARIENIAGLDETFVLSGRYDVEYSGNYRPWSTKKSLGEYFSLIAPALLEEPEDSDVRDALSKAVLQDQRIVFQSHIIDNQPYQTFKIQLIALGLVEVTLRELSKGGRELSWKLTEEGKMQMFQIRVLRTAGN